LICQAVGPVKKGLDKIRFPERHKPTSRSRPVCGGYHPRRGVAATERTWLPRGRKMMAERCTYLQAALRRAAHLPGNCRRQNGVGRYRL